MTRPVEFVEGFDALVVRAVELVGSVPGARDFELSYDAEGTKPVTRVIEGTAIVPPGGAHAQGIVDAVVELLRKLGANVNVLIVPKDGPE